jgi:3-oxoacyl-[acyl-carrier protein] reductase
MTRKAALVFGGSRGIGAAIVAALARDGHDVAFTHTGNSEARDIEGPGGPCQKNSS